MTVKVTVHFFKPLGKWYTTEEILFPADCAVWHARAIIEVYLQGRLEGMTATITDDASPWGYPISFHRMGRGRAND